MSKTVFFRLLAEEDEATAQQGIASLQKGDTNHVVHFADPESFRQVPGSPFAY